MKKKFLTFILSLFIILPCTLCLVACDLFPGGDELDTTLYHLTLSYSSNVASLEGFKQEDLTAEYAYGEHGECAYLPQDEKDAFREAGAKEEDIEKAGVRQADGSYWFFDGDPMHVYAPEVEGYVFLGFYNKSNGQLFVNSNKLTDVNGQMAPARENMLQKDVELEARYKALTYSISYCYGISSGPDRTHTGLMPQGTHTNPLTYNYEVNPNVTLSAPTEIISGYEFKYWYYYDNGTQKQVICTELPKVYNEDVIHTMSYDASGNPIYGLTLFAVYEEKFYSFTFEPENPIIWYGKVEVLRGQGSVASVDIPEDNKDDVVIDTCKTGDVVRVILTFNGLTANEVHEKCNFEGIANADGDIVVDGSLIVDGHSYFEITIGEEDVVLHLVCSPKPE